MAFTASNLPTALVKLDRIFLEGNLRDVKINWPAVTVMALAENQTVDVTPLTPNQPCLEVDAWFYQSGASHLIHNRTAPDPAQGCELKEGAALATEKQRFANNYDIKSGFTLERERCNNASTATDEIARGLAVCMATNRRKFNNSHAIPLLLNNLQANVAPDGVVNGFETESGNLLRYDPEKFNYEGIRAFELLAMNNHLNDVVIIAGGAFYQARDLDQFLVQDDDKRSHLAAFNESQLYFDPKNLDPAVRAVDATITTPVAFAVDPSVFLTWSTQLYTEGSPLDQDGRPVGTASPEDPSKNYYTFSVADPYLKYNDRGTLKPYYHNVEMEFKCIGIDSRSGKRVYGYEFNVTMSGGLHKAPNGHNWALDDSASASATLTGIIGVTAKKAPEAA